MPNSFTLKLWSLKKRPCADCNQTFHPVCMQFDHVPERGEKLYTISDLLATHQQELLKIELTKCDLVCANCHALRTWNRGMMPKTKRSIARAKANPAFSARMSSIQKIAQNRESTKRALSESGKAWRSKRRLKRLIQNFDRKIWMQMLLGN